MTLIGFARAEGHVIYANPERILRDGDATLEHDQAPPDGPSEQ